MIMNHKEEFDRICYLLKTTESFKVDGVVKEMLIKLMVEYQDMTEEIRYLEDRLYEISEIASGEDYEED